MRCPRQFYYKQTQSTIHYTRTPTGSLAIKELVEGKPCWVAPTLPRVEKPKSLILADWTASAWSLEKIGFVKNKLSELMNEGWAIYLWQNGSVNLMNKQSLSSLHDSNIRQAMTLASSQEIIKAAVIQNKLTQDTVTDYGKSQPLNDSGNKPCKAVSAKATVLFTFLSTSR